MKKSVKEILQIAMIALMGISASIAFVIKTDVVKASTDALDEELEPIEITINQDIEKYFELEEEQVLLQQKITVATNSNNKKEEERLHIEAPVLQGKKPEEAILLINGNRANEQCYTYDGIEGVVNIKIDSNMGTTIDSYKIIYQYNEIIAQEQDIVLNTKVYTKIENVKDEIETTDEKQITISYIGEKVSIQGEMTSEVYKGYLYEAKGKETEYQENYIVEISNMQNVEEINIMNEKPEYTYYQEERQTLAVEVNSYFKRTEINKESITKLLGESGKITIKDQNEQIIAEITNDTQTDENGNIIIEYANKETKSIKIEITKPEQLGTLKILNYKAIGANTTYTREQLETIEFLEETIRANESTQNLKMALLDIETEASIEISQQELSTLVTNTNVEMVATLKSNNNKQELYKNPEIKIILPESVENIIVNSINKLNDEELNIEEAKLGEEDGRKVIIITLSGEQTSYIDNINEGIQIVINANIDLKKDTPTGTSQIIMNYTNKNDSSSEAKQDSIDINIVSKYGMMVYSKVGPYNEQGEEKESIDETNIETQLDIQSDEKIIPIQRTIINNYTTEITNIEISGILSNIGESIEEDSLETTYQITLNGPIKVNNENVKIHYSEDYGQTWGEEVKDFSKVTNYKIELPEERMQPGETLKIEYDVKIPEKLGYLEASYEGIEVAYKYGDQGIKNNYYTQFTTKAKGVQDSTSTELTGSIQEIEQLGKVSIQAITGGTELKDGEEIFEGQTIKYLVTIINDTDQKIKNLSLVAKHTNAIFLDKNITQEVNTSTLEPMNVTYIVENEELTQKEFTLDELNVGEKVTFEYEFVVKENAGEKTTGTIDIQTATTQNTIQTISNTIKDAKLKLTERYSFNEEVEVVGNSTFHVTLKPKNISTEELQNVVLEVQVPENTKFRPNELQESEKYELLEYDDKIVKIKINDLQIQEELEIYVAFEVEQIPYDELEREIKSMYTATIGEDIYVSNQIIKKVKQIETKITITQTGSITEENVKTGDKLSYKANIKNEGLLEAQFNIEDQVPSAAVIQNVYIIQDGKKEENIELAGDNFIQKKVTLSPGSEIEFVVETLIDEEKTTDKEISNEIILSGSTVYKKSNSITYAINNNNNDDNDSNGDNNDNEKDDGKDEILSSILGVAWIDENQDGERQSSEITLEGVEVQLINVKNGENVKTSKTNSQGSYTFEEIPSGEYIVRFYYDTTRYRLTEYKKDGVEDSLNSDVINKQVDGTQVATTDVIKLSKENCNIDAGFIKTKKFDLKLDKYIKNVIVQSNTGTKVIGYDQAKLAKVELDAKSISGSIILVEYEIAITNEGELSGYVNDIIDYLPSGMEFSSEINKDWYLAKDKSVHSVSLSNDMIKPGETKTISLILTKTANENTGGTVTNIAEIGSSTNSELVADIDSKAGNKQDNEDDISKAELIISIRTGLGVVISIGLIIILLIVGIIIVYRMKKRRKSDE